MEKVQGSKQHNRRMHATSHRSLPERQKAHARGSELNDEVKQRRKIRSETRKERKENVERTHSTLANRRASVEEGKEESTRRLQSTNMYARETTV